MSFDFSYRKLPFLEHLYKGVEASALETSDCQLYSPIANRFLVFNSSNYHNTTFNHKWAIKHSPAVNKNIIVDAELEDTKNNSVKRDVFIKISPLFDPVKYARGKLEDSIERYLELPKWGDESKGCKDAQDVNNVPYVDSFFSYLSSQMLNHHGFIHGLDYYGSVLGVQKEYNYEAIDELELLEESDYFRKNVGHLFKIDETVEQQLFNRSLSNKPPLKLVEETSEIAPEIGEMELSDLEEELSDIEPIEIAPLTEHNLEIHESSNPEKDNIHISDIESEDTDYCSSRSSNTMEDTETTESNVSTESSDYESEASALLTIFDYPVQLSFLERCKDTLDHLLVSDEIELSEKELESAILQILFTLVAYQKCFGLTHNDLHTNNVMFVPTERPNLYYRFDNRHYKVPTYGRIFKIIDFGRAIYRFRGNIICSNSFAPNGDAGGQYNCEPFFQENKPRLEPNYSFDLSRLGTSMYDYFVEDCGREDEEEWWPVIKLILGWCKDDKGRNVLYKSNGEERYPNFKLYKMITRTVHNHKPTTVLSNKLWEKYIVSRKTINKAQRIINIDTLPIYV